MSIFMGIPGEEQGGSTSETQAAETAATGTRRHLQSLQGSSPFLSSHGESSTALMGDNLAF